MLEQGSEFTFTTRVFEINQDSDEFRLSYTHTSESNFSYQSDDFIALSNPVIHFQGVSFDTKLSHSIPVEVMRGKVLPKFEYLSAFLLTMEQHDLFRTKNKQGTVMHIDD